MVKALVGRWKINVVCLMETRVKEEHAKRVKDCIVPDWGFIHNCVSHGLGRICVCWKFGTIMMNMVCHIDQVICYKA